MEMVKMDEEGGGRGEVKNLEFQIPHKLHTAIAGSAAEYVTKSHTKRKHK